jgi:hypothetical protein
MSAHTPGPWRAKKATVRGEVNEWYVTDDDGVAVIASCVTDIAGEPSEANARLIAAAPDTAAERDRLREINAELLFKLISAANYIKNLGGDEKPYLGSINKAKGGAA